MLDGKHATAASRVDPGVYETAWNMAALHVGDTIQAEMICTVVGQEADCGQGTMHAYAAP